jgi:uncharacterized protein YxjI
MRLLFKQRFFTWFDTYDIYNEENETVFTVEGQVAWGHKLEIYDRTGTPVGMLNEKLFRFLPTFEMYTHGNYVGCIKKEFNFFRPSFQLDMNGWRVEGNWLEWDYTIQNSAGECIASVSKQLWNLTDTYTIDVLNDSDALCALMLVIAIDAEKCSRRD